MDRPHLRRVDRNFIGVQLGEGREGKGEREREGGVYVYRRFLHSLHAVGLPGKLEVVVGSVVLRYVLLIVRARVNINIYIIPGYKLY